MSDGGVIGKLARGLAERRDVLSAWVGVNDAAVAEALARESFDAVTLDLQHGGVDFVGAAQAILAVALAGKPTIARIPVGDFALASRLVDAGAAAVIAPMIDDAATARRFAEHVKFPPLGQRSWGPRAAQALSGCREQASAVQERNQLLGPGLPAQRPQPLAGTAGKDQCVPHVWVDRLLQISARRR